jgi:transposase-like protein
MNDRTAAQGDRGDAGPTAEDKFRAVLSVLSNRASCAQEALRRSVPETEVEHWRQLFIDSGSVGLLASGRPKAQPSTIGLGAQNAALKSALHKKLIELRCYRQMANGLLGPSHGSAY